MEQKSLSIPKTDGLINRAPTPEVVMGRGAFSQAMTNGTDRFSNRAPTPTAQTHSFPDALPLELLRFEWYNFSTGDSWSSHSFST